MSIQSEAERIKGEVAAQEALIAQISAVLDGKAGGGTSEPVEEKDVNFWDYDGTLLYSYTLAEAQALTELPEPPNPPKDFLEFEEWNWSLDQIKAYNDFLDVGAVYKTTDGKTYAIIQIDEDWQKTVTLRYGQWCSSIVVDWGDGSVEPPTTASNGTSVTKQHTYADTGVYTITVQANGTWNMGLNSTAYPFIGDPSLESGALILKECYIGSGARLLAGAFIKARAMERVTMPKSATRTWSGAFTWCASLRCVILPSTFTTMDGQTFNYCMGLSICSLPPGLVTMSYYAFNAAILKRLTIPDKLESIAIGGAGQLRRLSIPTSGLKSIGSECFINEYLLKEFVVPLTVTNIGSQAFYNMYSMMRLKFLPGTPPTVTNANAFTGIPSTCIVEVPAASLEAYQNATNYSGIAAQMIGV